MISLSKHYDDPKKLLKDIDEGFFISGLKEFITNQSNDLFPVYCISDYQIVDAVLIQIERKNI